MNTDGVLKMVNGVDLRILVKKNKKKKKLFFFFP